MTHTPDNCPAELPPAQQKKFYAEADKMQKAARRMNVNVHFWVVGVGHTMYALVEADTFKAMNMFFSDAGFKQDYQIEPVDHAKNIIAALKTKLSKK